MNNLQPEMHRDYPYQEQSQMFYQGQAIGPQQPLQSEYQSALSQDMPYARPMSYAPLEQFPARLPHDDARVGAALCYSVGWLSGLLFALFASDNRYLRYHALQSLIFFGGINLLDVGLITYISSLHRLFAFLPGIFLAVTVLSFLLLNFVAFVGWIVSMVQAYRGKYYRLPIAGNLAARIMHVDVSLK